VGVEDPAKRHDRASLLLEKNLSDGAERIVPGIHLSDWWLVPKFNEGLHPEIQAAMDNALSVLGKLTSFQQKIEIPNSPDNLRTIKRGKMSVRRP
jgi:hypothetical protein